LSSCHSSLLVSRHLGLRAGIATALDKMQGEKNGWFVLWCSFAGTACHQAYKFDSRSQTYRSPGVLFAGRAASAVWRLDDFHCNTRKKALLLASVSHPYFKLRWLIANSWKATVSRGFVSAWVGSRKHCWEHRYPGYSFHRVRWLLRLCCQFWFVEQRLQGVRDTASAWSVTRLSSAQ